MADEPKKRDMNLIYLTTMNDHEVISLKVRDQ